MIRIKLITPKLLKVLTNGFATGMALFPFVLLKNRAAASNKRLMNHETIHLKQQLEMLIIPFYIWYGIEYLIRRISSKSHYEAYRHISLEREAYSNDQNLVYLKNRKFWAFLKYIK
jgi:hypothetical protein